MAADDWQFADEFKSIYERALVLSKALRKVFGKQQSPVLAPNGKPFQSDDDSAAGSGLISWEGTSNFAAWLNHYPSQSPPPKVLNFKRAKPNEVFCCWLMLPDMREEPPRWYFGHVFGRKNPALAEFVEAFQTIANKAGKLLRTDSSYWKHFSGFVAHTEFIQRIPSFGENMDASYWCALLFFRPNILKAWDGFKYLKNEDGSATLSLDDPFQTIADAIVSWDFAAESPLPVTGHFIKPYQWQRVEQNLEFSPWIETPRMIELMLANGIRAANKRGFSDRSITRMKNKWQAEPQTGSNNRRFRFKLAKLKAEGIKYPPEWNQAQT